MKWIGLRYLLREFCLINSICLLSKCDLYGYDLIRLMWLLHISYVEVASCSLLIGAISWTTMDCHLRSMLNMWFKMGVSYVIFLCHWILWRDQPRWANWWRRILINGRTQLSSETYYNGRFEMGLFLRGSNMILIN